MQDDLLTDAAEALLRDRCTPEAVRAIEAGGDVSALWQAIEDAGFADALVPEAQGGAGLSLPEVFGLWTSAGAHALPLPLGTTMLARALLARAGHASPAGPIALAEALPDGEGGLRCASVALARVAAHVLVQAADGWHLLPVRTATPSDAAFVLDAGLHWSGGALSDAPRLAIEAPTGIDARTLLAIQAAAHLAGSLMTVFTRTLAHANERQQFGRPIGKFQAIQHQLAVMSEQVFAARMAAQLGCAAQGPWPDRLRVAVAKARCSQAALAVAEAGHAIHGAIGFTAEFDLQLHTRRLHAWRQCGGAESYWWDVVGAALVDGRAHTTLDWLRTLTDPTVSQPA
ncbi:acyl-CoA dehydrogenase family protein [uncultured Pseudacidovorax sp.]|uniref:acyl-CoA dehydrogenase family protein n=1 Tax=uncultured Pseudacidovorax sp. TaxID=679313 RepID=UPI0025D1F4AD|nr:acyl-CoA dehydrogenase family protein [uncultured Pseudacidovorax sp.]